MALIFGRIIMGFVLLQAIIVVLLLVFLAFYAPHPAVFGALILYLGIGYIAYCDFMNMFRCVNEIDFWGSDN